MTNGSNCLNIREICIVKRQSALRVTTFLRQTSKLLLRLNFKRVQNQSTLQDSMDSSERPHLLVNYSFTDDSDEESELPQSNSDTTDDEDIASDDDHHQTSPIAQQTLKSK